MHGTPATKLSRGTTGAHSEMVTYNTSVDSRINSCTSLRERWLYINMHSLVYCFAILVAFIVCNPLKKSEGSPTGVGPIIDYNSITPIKTRRYHKILRSQPVMPSGKGNLLHISPLFDQNIDRLFTAIEEDRTRLTRGVWLIFHRNITWRLWVFEDRTFFGLFAIKNIPTRSRFKKNF